MYIGGYKDDRQTEGKVYELQPDKTHTIFIVKYDDRGEEIEKREISKGHEIN